MVFDVSGGGGATVVLLHGQPGLGDDWRWVVRELDPELRVVVPDRPGYGRTGGPATGFSGNADAVVEMLDRLGAERAVIAGHSWAGGAALACARDHPDRVAGLVLASSVGPGERITWEDRMLAAPVVGDLLAAGFIGGLGLILSSAWVQSVADRRLPARAEDAVVALSKLTRSRAPVWRSFVAEQRSLLTELEDLAPALGRMEMPTEIVHGRSDRLVPYQVAELLGQRIPGARVTLLPGIGHLVPHDAPAALAHAVNDVARRSVAGG
jgi:pimeloyl-ACP methyl ester carboxylesterase